MSANVSTSVDAPTVLDPHAVHVLFVASEIYPLAKTGGLADVCAALPQALCAQGLDVQLMMPAYPDALYQLVAPRPVVDLGEVLPGARVRLIHGHMPDSGLPTWLVDCPSLYRRPGTPYRDPDGRDWPDNARRYGVLCHAAARMALNRCGLAWVPHVVHCHDWHTGLLPLLLQLGGGPRPSSVFTIHNAAFQGNYPLATLAKLGLPEHLASAEGIEFFGQMSFLKAGIRYADKVTTVSPTYARELCTPEFGFGMEGLLNARRDDLHGIINGIDDQLWNPQADPYLPFRYRATELGGKRGCKRVLQDMLGLDPDPMAPLAVSVSRLTQQKMADIVLQQLPVLLQRHSRLQFALHGNGDREIESGLMAMAAQWPGRVAVRIGYSEALAHRLHAGADLLLHPSRFEPCGLAQMYAMRYGTVPVVRRVGGLADSVVDTSQGAGRATGFVFDAANGAAFVDAVERGLGTFYAQPDSWSALQRGGMHADFSWRTPAQAYMQLYAQLLGVVLMERDQAGSGPNLPSLIRHLARPRWRETASRQAS
ncbi:glycogen synthase GlgA [Oleiagrimonas sp. C23AA]|uniref:glycogen synthase GlgA n=1 Tax=Oleiagrimonas sp. C23AA TaxID=2719047 RepID=UPI001420ACB5|nr:glycogen synthase GlgA [Oleiagrimonas sp. C23AA]NII11091.1 glycogen synthase GlgA [Oleiagrimonas sp. C23AA]